MQSDEIQWLPCKKCGELRSHFPIPGTFVGAPLHWLCSLCGTQYKPPRMAKKKKR